MKKNELFITVHSSTPVDNQDGYSTKAMSLILLWKMKKSFPILSLAFMGAPSTARLCNEIVVCGTFDGIIHIWDLRNHDRIAAHLKGAPPLFQPENMYPKLAHGLKLIDLNLVHCSAIVDIVIIPKGNNDDLFISEMISVDANGDFIIW